MRQGAVEQGHYGTIVAAGTAEGLGGEEEGAQRGGVTAVDALEGGEGFAIAALTVEDDAAQQRRGGTGRETVGTIESAEGFGGAPVGREVQTVDGKRVDEEAGALFVHTAAAVGVGADAQGTGQERIGAQIVAAGGIEARGIEGGFAVVGVGGEEVGQGGGHDAAVAPRAEEHVEIGVGFVLVGGEKEGNAQGGEVGAEGGHCIGAEGVGGRGGEGAKTEGCAVGRGFAVVELRNGGHAGLGFGGEEGESGEGGGVGGRKGVVVVTAEAFGLHHVGRLRRGTAVGGEGYEGEGGADGELFGREGEVFVVAAREIGGGAQEIEFGIGRHDAQHVALARTAVADEGAVGAAEGRIGGDECAVGFDEETVRHGEGVARGIEGDDAGEGAEGGGVCAAVGTRCTRAEEDGAKAEEKDEQGAGHGRKSRWVKR